YRFGAGIVRSPLRLGGASQRSPAWLRRAIQRSSMRHGRAVDIGQRVQRGPDFWLIRSPSSRRGRQAKGLTTAPGSPPRQALDSSDDYPCDVRRGTPRRPEANRYASPATSLEEGIG